MLYILHFSEVYHDWIVFFRRVTATELFYFCHLNIILLVYVFGSFRPIVVRFVQCCRAVDAVYSDRVEIVSQELWSSCQVRFYHSLYRVVFLFISVGDSNVV